MKIDVDLMAASVAGALALAASLASAQETVAGRLLVPHPFATERPRFVRVGHEPIAPDPTIRRYTGKIGNLGPLDGKGNVYSFTPVPVGPRNFSLSTDDLRGWRMTMLSGKRFGNVFRVKGNSESQITVNADSGPIDGVAVNDVFVIESIDANGASMFAPATGSSGSPGSGA